MKKQSPLDHVVKNVKIWVSSKTQISYMDLFHNRLILTIGDGPYQ